MAAWHADRTERPPPGVTFARPVRAALVAVVLAAVAAPAVWTLAPPHAPPARQEAPGSLTEPKDILAELEAGNRRFVESRRVRSADTRRDGAERRQFAKGQHPIIGLLTCADSRIVPEFVFDQHL